jgi:plasmid stabilization system protein ParE
MAKVQISPLAQQDLLNIRQYIETELANPVAARRTVERMLKAIRQLEQFPLSGAPLQYNGADTGYRYVTSGNYVAIVIASVGGDYGAIDTALETALAF